MDIRFDTVYKVVNPVQLAFGLSGIVESVYDDGYIDFRIISPTSSILKQIRLKITDILPIFNSENCEKEEIMEEIVLVLQNGEQVILNIPEDVYDEVYAEMFTYWQTNSIWNVGNWTTVEAVFGGVNLSDIHMGRVVGIHE